MLKRCRTYSHQSVQIVILCQSLRTLSTPYAHISCIILLTRLLLSNFNNSFLHIINKITYPPCHPLFILYIFWSLKHLVFIRFPDAINLCYQILDLCHSLTSFHSPPHSLIHSPCVSFFRGHPSVSYDYPFSYCAFFLAYGWAQESFRISPEDQLPKNQPLGL